MRTRRTEEVIEDLLVEGDHITVTASHQMYIDGDQTWLTVKIGGKVLENEETHDAVVRIVHVVSAAMRRSVKETVENVRRIGGEEQS